jgi:hypothetical protein
MVLQRGKSGVEVRDGALELFLAAPDTFVKSVFKSATCTPDTLRIASKY